MKLNLFVVSDHDLRDYRFQLMQRRAKIVVVLMLHPGLHSGRRWLAADKMSASKTVPPMQ